MVGMEIWLVPALEYRFEKLSGEEQKNGGRHMRIGSKVDIECSIK